VRRVRQAIPFGKYLLLDRISVGGMAEVFRAKSYGVEGFEKVIAIKRILPSMGEDRDFIKMFIDEAKIAGQLAHANVCQIFELGRSDGAHFIAMEFIWGKDLLQIQNRVRKLKQAMSPAMACFVVAKVCEGLDYAHRKRDPMGRPLEIVHRDCSPQNVLISYEGEVKIIDFGIAKAASRSSRTMHGVLKGKFGYMSPEQVRGLPLDRRSDIFALGTILYECLTGERLFQGDTDFATLEKVRNVDIVPPRQINPAVPEAVEHIIMTALARDVDHRYQWCSQMLADLQAFLMAQPAVFTAKSLASWMKEGFAAELERERQQLEGYKKTGRDGLIAGVPAAHAKLDVVEHFGQAGQAEDPTILGGPTFDDVVLDGATQISAPGMMEGLDAPPLGPNLPAVAGEVAARERDSQRDFPEEDGPTTIFGELDDDDDADTLSPADKVKPPSLPAPPALAHPAIGRSTHQTPAVPVPRPGTGGAPPAQPPPAMTSSPAARTLYGIAPPAGAQPHGAPGQPYAPPPVAAPGDPTITELGTSQRSVAQLVAQAQAELARARAEAQAAQAATLPPPPSGPASAGSAHQAYYPGWQPGQAAPTWQPGPGGGWQPAAGQPWQAGPAAQTWQPSQGAAPAWDPAQYPQHSGPYAANGQPVFTPSGVAISPSQPESTMPVPALPAATGERRGRPSLGKDIAIGIAIAAVVLGAVAIIKYAVLGDESGARSAEAATAGTIVVDVSQGEGAEVFVGGQKRGIVEHGSFRLEKVVPGAHEVRVVRSGGEPCAAQLELAGGEVETVKCVFAAPVPTTVSPLPGVAPVPTAPVPAAATAPPAVVAAPAPPPKVEADPKLDATVDPKLDDAKVAPAKPAPRKKPAATTVESPARTLARAAAKTDVAATDGYLVAYTTPWAKVVIDGKDTGKMTPIAPRAKISLAPGKHKVTFVVGRENWSYTITINAGETSKVTKDLPVSSP